MTIPDISAHTEIILDEIRLDMCALLRSFVGLYNTQSLRDGIIELTTAYFYNYEEVQSAIVICDENNNSANAINVGELNVDVMFMIAGHSFHMNSSVVPGVNGYNPDINVDISVRNETPERKVFFVDIGKVSAEDQISFLSEITNAVYLADIEISNDLNVLASSLIPGKELVWSKDVADDYKITMTINGDFNLWGNLDFTATLPKSQYAEMPTALANSLKV